MWHKDWCRQSEAAVSLQLSSELAGNLKALLEHSKAQKFQLRQLKLTSEGHVDGLFEEGPASGHFPENDTLKL